MFVRIAAVAAVLLAPAAAMAQDYQRVAPKLPPNVNAPTVVSGAPEPAATATVNSDTQVLSTLKGLVFVSDTHQFLAKGVGSIPAGGVDASRVPGLDESGFMAEMAPFIGRPLTLGDLAKIRAITIDWKRRQQDPFINVTIPPQNITSGVIQVIVTQYWLGAVTVEGNRHFSQKVVKNYAGFKPGTPLNMNIVQSHMDRANQNPFLDVNAVFQPGTQPGETDLVLKSKDKYPLRAYVGYDNNGVPSLGIGEAFFGFNWGNVLGTGQIFSYQYTRSISGMSISHSASDTIPINWNNQLLIYGSYQTSKSDVLDQIFDSKGKSGQVSVRFVHFLQRYGRLSQDVQVGYDFKTTNNNLDFFGYNVFSQNAQIDQFSVTYDGTLPDNYGETTVENIFMYSPGGMTGKNTDAVFRNFVPGASANYVYDNFQVTRLTALPWNMSSVSRATVQFATHNLLDSEQLSGGGVGSVRGYYVDTALGSDGVILGQEFRAPPIRLPLRLKGVESQLQLGAFVDYANLWEVTKIPDQYRDDALLSTGVSAEMAVGPYLNVQWDIGWRLKSAQMEPKRGAFGNISVVASF